LTNLAAFNVGNNLLTGAVPPAPSSLQLGDSSLCSNPLDTTPSADPAIDAAWDQATGLTPWWSAFKSQCDILFRDSFE